MRSPYTTKWQFRDPHILKIVFSRPPYTNKWHFPDHLYNKIGDKGMRKLEISRPPYKNVSSRPPNTTKWHFWDPPYAKKCIYETTHIIQQNGIFKTPHRKNAFLRPPIQELDIFKNILKSCYVSTIWLMWEKQKRVCDHKACIYSRIQNVPDKTWWMALCIYIQKNVISPLKINIFLKNSTTNRIASLQQFRWWLISKMKLIFKEDMMIYMYIRRPIL